MTVNYVHRRVVDDCYVKHGAAESQATLYLQSRSSQLPWISFDLTVSVISLISSFVMSNLATYFNAAYGF